MSLPAESERRIPTLGVVMGHVVCDPNLSATDVRVYAALCLFRDRETSECYPSNETLARTLCVSRRTVIRSLDVLVEQGIIRRLERFVEGRQTTSLTVIQDALPARHGRLMDETPG